MASPNQSPTPDPVNNPLGVIYRYEELYVENGGITQNTDPARIFYVAGGLGHVAQRLAELHLAVGDNETVLDILGVAGAAYERLVAAVTGYDLSDDSVSTAATDGAAAFGRTFFDELLEPGQR